MQKFLLQFSVCSLLLSCVLACKSYNLTGATEIKTDKTELENRYFSTTEDYIYRCQIDIYDNHLSGLLILKQTSENVYRIVLTTDFGNKLMDFELSENGFKVNYIVSDMDKKIVRNFLKKDFSILLKRHFPITKQFITDTKQSIYLSENNKQAFYWYINSTDKSLEKLVFVENGKEKINFLYDSKTPIFADKILINHIDYKINFTLQKLTE